MLVVVRRSALILMLAVGGCTSAADPTGLLGEDIIGGVTDASDPGVVLLYFTTPGQSGGSLCTGEVVSPHVVLTAAHCAGGEAPSVTSTFHVYLGDDFASATTADLLPVAEAHFHPAFDPGDLAAGNDVGVLITRSPLPSTIAPLAYNHASMDDGFDGRSVRFVGYGLDDAAAQTGGGLKRSTTTTLTDHTALLLHFADATHETCNGDSGGPAFMTNRRAGAHRRPDVVRRCRLRCRRLRHARRRARRVDRRLGRARRSWLPDFRYATGPLRWHAVSPDVVRDADAPLVDGRGRRWGELRFL